MTRSKPKEPQPSATRQRLGFGVAATVLCWPLAAAAADGHSNSLVLSLVVPLLLGAIALAVVAFHTYRKDRARAEERRAESARRQGTRIISRVPPIRPPPHSAAGRSNMVALNLSQAEETRVPFPMPPQAAVKVCPTCTREFRTALTRCPFDQSRLVDKGETLPAPGQRDYLDTKRALMRCGTCERRFDIGASFCPYDGERLEAVDEDDERALFDGVMSCPQCGGAFDEDASFCPEDGARLVPSETGDAASAYAAVPLRICPTCTTEYPATIAVCPKDSAPLLTLAGRTTGGHPVQGLGPRTKICPDCGTRYSGDAAYCAEDGIELRSLN